MPLLNVPIDPKKGPVLQVRVNGMPCQALIDTGAQYTSVDESLVYELGMRDAGKITVLTATSEGEEAGAYEATVAIEGPPNSYSFVAKGLRVVSAKLNRQGYLAILGRDVLAHVHLGYDGPSAACRIAY